MLISNDTMASKIQHSEIYRHSSIKGGLALAISMSVCFTSLTDSIALMNLFPHSILQGFYQPFYCIYRLTISKHFNVTSSFICMFYMQQLGFLHSISF